MWPCPNHTTKKPSCAGPLKPIRTKQQTLAMELGRHISLVGGRYPGCEEQSPWGDWEGNLGLHQWHKVFTTYGHFSLDSCEHVNCLQPTSESITSACRNDQRNLSVSAEQPERGKPIGNGFVQSGATDLVPALMPK